MQRDDGGESSTLPRFMMIPNDMKVHVNVTDPLH